MIEVFVPKGARRMNPSGALGDEAGSLGRPFPVINRRATIMPSLRDEEDLRLIHSWLPGSSW
jgi:hypothetical protein